MNLPLICYLGEFSLEKGLEKGFFGDKQIRDGAQDFFWGNILEDC